MITQVGKVYRYRGALGIFGNHWTIYQQEEDCMFFSGSSAPGHLDSVGTRFPRALPGSTKGRRWEELV